MSSLDMTEATFQFVIKLFSIVVAAVILAVLGTFVMVVWRDGNNPLVQNAFADLVALGQWAIGILGAVVIGKPIATGLQNIMQANALSKSPAQTPAILPASLPTSTPIPPSAGGV